MKLFVSLKMVSPVLILKTTNKREFQTKIEEIFPFHLNLYRFFQLLGDSLRREVSLLRNPTENFEIH